MIHHKKLRRENIIVTILIGIGLVMLLLFFTHPEKLIVKNVVVLPTPTSIPSPIPEKKVNSYPIIATPIPTSQINPTMISIPASPEIKQPTIVPHEVRLSINGDASFSVALPPESNQCDVLTKALEQQKISSLTMRYDETYKTYGIYQINGIGKENTVWWVYKINGQSATQGCSYIKANNGDTVEWKYIGS